MLLARCLSASGILAGSSIRNVASSSQAMKWKIKETETDDTLVVEMEKIDEPLRPKGALCTLCSCNLPVKLKYSDVLILEQFMRPDGTVLPRQLTGLCKGKQLQLERCVMQAHWCGLFPDKTIPEFDLAGYKNFKRYWNDDMAMYKIEEKVEPGSWYYIKRYQTKNRPYQLLMRDPLNRDPLHTHLLKKPKKDKLQVDPKKLVYVK